jgi:hypothetical protein
VKLTSITLRKAAEIQENIEKLQADLGALLENSIESIPSSAPDSGAAIVTGRKRGRKPRSSPPMAEDRGRRSTSPSGSLAPVVVKVLKSKGSPMTVAEILDDLMSSGYKFTSPEPKKNLFARIYRLKGVKQVGPGRFAAK